MDTIEIKPKDSPRHYKVEKFRVKPPLDPLYMSDINVSPQYSYDFNNSKMKK